MRNIASDVAISAADEAKKPVRYATFGRLVTRRPSSWCAPSNWRSCAALVTKMSGGGSLISLAPGGLRRLPARQATLRVPKAERHADPGADQRAAFSSVAAAPHPSRPARGGGRQNQRASPTTRPERNTGHGAREQLVTLRLHCHRRGNGC